MNANHNVLLILKGSKTESSHAPFFGQIPSYPLSKQEGTEITPYSVGHLRRPCPVWLENPQRDDERTAEPVLNKVQMGKPGQIYFTLRYREMFANILDSELVEEIRTPVQTGTTTGKLKLKTCWAGKSDRREEAGQPSIILGLRSKSSLRQHTVPVHSVYYFSKRLCLALRATDTFLRGNDGAQNSGSDRPGKIYNLSRQTIKKRIHI